MLKMNAEAVIQTGFLVVLLGFALIIMGEALQSKESSGRSRVEWAFGGFIGPIPFGFASRSGWLKFIIVLSIIFLFIFVLLNRKLLGA